MQPLFIDGGYAGQCAQTLHDTPGLIVEVARHPAHGNDGSWHHAGQGQLFPVKADVNGFVALPKRWVVERTHGWNERARRLIMHHDRLTHVSEARVWLAGSMTFRVESPRFIRWRQGACRAALADA